MARRKRATTKPFEAVFQEALDQIYADSKEVGIALIDLAEEVGISRAQFARWKRKAPATIQAMTKLQAAIEARRRMK